MTAQSIEELSDRALLDAASSAAQHERGVTAELLALLAELDARRLYLGEGCSSLFAYCVQLLHFSEHAAYHRIETARAARHFPVILEMVADGSVTTTAVALLRPHLTAENHLDLLRAARHKTKREVEHQLACLAPRPPVASLVRRVSVIADEKRKPEPAAQPQSLEPVPTTDTGDAAPPVTGPAVSAPAPRPKVETLASDRYLLRVTLSGAAHAHLRRAQNLLGHSVPNGDRATIVEKALALLVTHLEHRKAATTPRPRGSRTPSVQSATSRYLPASVRREVWARDGGRCAFVGSHGRCQERSRLEFHHLVPFARGGAATPDHIALRCRAHNNHEAEQSFGRWEPTRAAGPWSTVS